MLKFQKTTNTSIASNATEVIFEETSFRALWRELTFTYDGDNATGTITSSKVIITIDGTKVLDENFTNLSNHFGSFGTDMVSTFGMVNKLKTDSANKRVTFRFANLDALIFSSLKIEIFNDDNTNAANIYASIIYHQPVPQKPVYAEAPVSA